MYLRYILMEFCSLSGSIFFLFSDKRKNILQLIILRKCTSVLKFHFVTHFVWKLFKLSQYSHKVTLHYYYSDRNFQMTCKWQWFI